jgi:hypothetical protein
MRKVLVWLDSGDDVSYQTPQPWSVRPPDYLLPVIRHKHMIALKCHLFTSPNSGDTSSATNNDQSVSHLPTDYGRSLRPNVMSRDAFYSANEVFNFAASSQMEFLNLIDIKLDKYTSLPSEQDFESLPNLIYTRQILNRHIQRTQRVIESIKNARSSRWPQDRSKSGKVKAAIAAQSLEQDFSHLLDRATRLHRRTTEAITVLMSSISISESKRAIAQAQRVGKLTFLAFFFIPLSFTTSFFGMNVKELEGGSLGLKWWVALSLLMTAATVAVFYLDMTPLRSTWTRFKDWLAGVIRDALSK